MSAWKSSDGGALHKAGSSSYSGTPAGVVSVVSAVSNTKGLILWTACITGAADGIAGRVIVGGIPVLIMRYVAAGGTPNAVHLAYPIFIPAGKALDVQGVFGTPEIYLTCDIL